MIKHSQKIFKAKGLLLIFLVFILIFLLSVPSFAQPRFDLPTANMEIENPVPFHLVKKIAQEKTVEIWGPGALGNPIPLCDLDGNLWAYMFPFHIGANRFPSQEEIFARIKEGRELHELIKNKQIEKAKEKYEALKKAHKELPETISQEKDRALSDPQIGMIPLIRPDGKRARSFEVAEIREMDKFARNKARGGDEFGTIVVSATYNRVPVPVYYYCLPFYFTEQDLAREKAEQTIGKDASLKKIYFLGMQGEVFEFANQRGKAIIHAATLEVKDEEFSKLRAKRQKTLQLSSTELQERRAKVREELDKDWETILTEVEQQKEGR